MRHILINVSSRQCPHIPFSTPHQLSRPFWLIGFLVVYYGNPIIFIMHILGRCVYFDKVHSCIDDSENWMKPVPYITLTLPMYILWVAGNIMVGQKHSNSSRLFDFDIFIASYASLEAVMVAMPGLFNMLIWREGRDFNMVFYFLQCFLPLCAGSAYFCMWISLWIDAFSRSSKSKMGVYRIPAVHFVQICEKV